MGTKNQKTLKNNMIKAIMAVRNKEMEILPAFKLYSAKINAERTTLTVKSITMKH
jgi:ABC-type enterochelin transport system substrate-binding protein